MSIDVVLVRARDPGATRELAQAIAARYGVPVDALIQRLSAGSFRVKSRADRETAHRYVRDLESMGAICELRDTATGELWVDPSEEPAGLAAASGQFSQQLGAIGDGNLSLATLDGGSGDTEPPPFGQPMAEPYNLQTPPAGVAVIPLDESAYEPPTELEKPTESGDAFLPPSSGTEDEELVLAVDLRVPVAGHEDAAPVAKTMAPEPGAGVSGPLAAQLGPMSSSAKPSRPKGPPVGERFSSVVQQGRLALARRTRGGFVAGALGAMLVGFFAAHIVGVFQETDAYSSVRKELLTSYSEATDPDSHAALSSLRQGASDLIESRQRKIAITGLLVWLMGAAGFAALWFRVIPWERLEPRSAQAAIQSPGQLPGSSSGSSSSGGGSSP